MKKFKCEDCSKNCISYCTDGCMPMSCLERGEEVNWQEVKEETVTNCNQLPKLTIEVFDDPDCPEWANYASVDAGGKVWFHEHKPRIVDYFWYADSWERPYQHHKEFDAFNWKNSLIERPVKKAKALPDWCKVGAMAWHNKYGYCEVKNITNHNEVILLDGSGEYNHLICSTEIGTIYQVRKRPFNDGEMQNLVGKVLENHKYLLWIEGYDKDTKRIVTLLNSFTAEELMGSDYLIDRAPCYVLEYLNEKGEWVE